MMSLFRVLLMGGGPGNPRGEKRKCRLMSQPWELQLQGVSRGCRVSGQWKVCVGTWGGGSRAVGVLGGTEGAGDTGGTVGCSGLRRAVRAVYAFPTLK